LELQKWGIGYALHLLYVSIYASTIAQKFDILRDSYSAVQMRHRQTEITTLSRSKSRRSIPEGMLKCRN
jgi:hypothetical protein